MPLRVSCLQKDTPLKEALFDVIEYVAYERIAAGKSAKLPSVYRSLRAAGVEVDLETVGYIYNEVFESTKDARFSSRTDIEDYTTKTYRDAINRLAELEAKRKPKEIDDQAAETKVANIIVDALYEDMVEDERITSDQRKLQDALWKGARRLLGKLENKNQQPVKKTMHEIIQESLGWEKIGIRDVNGQLNGISDLFNAMRRELAKASYEIRGEETNQELIDRYNEYVRHLENATYKLLFSAKDAKQVVYDAMKEAGFAKNTKDGTIMDWTKLAGMSNSVTEIRNNVDRVLTEKGYSQDVVDRLKDSLQQEFFDLRTEIMERSQKELERRAEAGTKPYKAPKSDLQRLVELYHLGVFNGSHNELLYKTIGVTELQAEDLADLEQLTRVASDLSRRIADPKGYNLGNDVFASREFQRIQRHIDNIIARNISDKTKTMRILRGITNFMDVMLSSLLGMPVTIAQNIFSGVQSVFTGIRFNGGPGGRMRTAQATEIYFAMLKDVASRGQAYGEEIGSFATRELFTNTLKWKWNKDATVLQKAKSLLYAGTAHLRLGLLAFDSANKVALTNKTFYNAIYNSLIKQQMPKEEVQKFMNEMLYGDSFEKAKERARQIIETNNAQLDPKFRSKVTNAEVITLANDLVKANLNTNQFIEAGILEAALKSSYHVAGLGLGHEPNNYISRQIKTYRDHLKNQENKLVTQKDWKALGVHRMKSMMVNNFIIRFTGGATNWIALRAKHGLGLGLVTGFSGGWNKDIDFANQKTLKDAIKEREDARNDIARALIGASYTALMYGLGFALVGGSDGDGTEEEKERLRVLKSIPNPNAAAKAEIAELESKNASVYKQIKENVSASRWFRALAPDAMLLQYYHENSKSGTMFRAALDYTYNVYMGRDKFSTPQKITEAMVLDSRGEGEAAMGKVASIAGDLVSVPLWRNYKEYYRLVTNPFKAEPTPLPKYEAPSNWKEAFFGGGALEDLGIFNRNSSVTIVPGVGAATYEKLKAIGYEKMSDLKDGWENSRDAQGKYILDADERRQAAKFYNEYKKQ